ncbi:hypothetical protein HC256_004747 [Beauveria bassiana]|nr:hypothetical protein HC256_004747 [Beauveria bassiana]
MSMQVAQLAIEWCLDHPEAEAGHPFKRAKPKQALRHCISNPNCAACTLPDITTVPVTTSIYELETLAPGTYTLTMSGTTKTAVVPLATFTITDFTTTVTATSTLTLTVTKDTTAKTTSVEIPSYKTIASTTIPDATKVSTVTATSILTMTVTSTSRSLKAV